MQPAPGEGWRAQAETSNEERDRGRRGGGPRPYRAPSLARTQPVARTRLRARALAVWRGGGNGPYRARSHTSSRGAVASCSLRQGRGGALRLKRATRNEIADDAGGTPLPRARWQCGMGMERAVPWSRGALSHCSLRKQEGASSHKASRRAGSHKASRRACCQAGC